MGYVTHVKGEFSISPPLTWTEIKDTAYAPDANITERPDLFLRIDEESVDTAEGTLTRRSAAALVMREIDEYRAYDLLEQVQRAVDAFPGHRWSGRLDCEGQENTDMWRVVIRDGKAQKVEPRIVWPDEDGAS